ncbi:ABC transporter permease [Thalassoroseus pseudoceratinae]|uniref:ABC transporter permease n=1 Tax=Thalassoroseus pseudoceratinae TaxID=2713176 RepID=UPI001422B9E0|nr:ABC transporter permease [Thalassoroseus pseudoceratinae]
MNTTSIRVNVGSLPVLLMIAMVSSGGVLDAADIPNDDAQIRGLLPAATAIEQEVWVRLTRHAEAPTKESFNDHSLSAELLLLDDKTVQDSNGEYRYLAEGLPKPSQLWKEISRVIVAGPVRVYPRPITMIHAERITAFNANVEGDSATGSFKFRVPDLYEGQASFTAIRHSSKWQITEMSMPGVGIHIARDATGRWRRVEASDDVTVLKGPHIIAASATPQDFDSINNPRYGLTRNDLKAIVATVPTVELVVPVREVRRVARFGDQTAEVRLVGTVPEYSQLHRLPIEQGRYLVNNDIKQLQSVAVIGAKVAQDLFRFENPIGRKIRIGDHYFIVVGVLAKQADTATKHARDIWIPITTMRSRLGDRDISRQAGTFIVRHFELSRIEIIVESFPEISRSTELVKRVLEHRHESDDFTVKDLSTELQGENP